MGCTGSKEAEDVQKPPVKSIVLTPTEVLARIQMPACPAFTVVAKATKKGDKKFIRVFLDGWSAQAREYGSELVDVAANQRQYHIWKMFLDAKIVDVNWKRPSGYCILMEAIFAHDNEMIHFLLESGANVNDRHLNNWTVVMLAVKEHSYRMLKTLLEYQFEGINEQTDEGYTALLLAVNQDIKDELKQKLAEMLLDEGADPNLVTSEGLAPLHVVALAGNLKICELLIAAGADVSMVGKQNKNCLHYAAMGGNVGIAKAIYSAHKKVNKTTLAPFMNAQTEGEGWTPLMFCANLGHTEIGLFLLEKGADSSIKSKDSDKFDGVSPYAMAKDSSSVLLTHIIPPSREDLELEDVERKAEEQMKAASHPKKKTLMISPEKKSDKSNSPSGTRAPLTEVGILNPVVNNANETNEGGNEDDAGTEPDRQTLEKPPNPPPSQLEAVGPPPMEGILRRADGNQNWVIIRAGVLSFHESADSAKVLDKREINDGTKVYTSDTKPVEFDMECDQAEFILQDGEYVEKFAAEDDHDKCEWV